jgi:hypothetical protein
LPPQTKLKQPKQTPLLPETVPTKSEKLQQDDIPPENTEQTSASFVGTSLQTEPQQTERLSDKRMIELNDTIELLADDNKALKEHNKELQEAIDSLHEVDTSFLDDKDLYECNGGHFWITKKQLKKVKTKK